MFQVITNNTARWPAWLSAVHPVSYRIKDLWQNASFWTLRSVQVSVSSSLGHSYLFIVLPGVLAERIFLNNRDWPCSQVSVIRRWVVLHPFHYNVKVYDRTHLSEHSLRPLVPSGEWGFGWVIVTLMAASSSQQHTVKWQNTSLWTIWSGEPTRSNRVNLICPNIAIVHEETEIRIEQK